MTWYIFHGKVKTTNWDFTTWSRIWPLWKPGFLKGVKTYLKWHHYDLWSPDLPTFFRRHNYRPLVGVGESSLTSDIPVHTMNRRVAVKHKFERHLQWTVKTVSLLRLRRCEKSPRSRIDRPESTAKTPITARRWSGSELLVPSNPLFRIHMIIQEKHRTFVPAGSVNV